MRSFGTSALSAADSRQNRMEAIRQLSVRLDRTLIEELDWQECVRRYDRPTTFFFFDPPYTECGKTSYSAWTDADVMRLRETLDGLRGQWLVTLNDTATIRKIFTGCRLTSVDRPMGINNRGGGKAKRYQELVIQPAAGKAVTTA